ncbi:MULTISPECIES: hypothetical protein [Catenuloplanes]|uniref:Uncharacterized protein n=1 Tax=Catenuloplanes niger TaxID=587534 RepID=A0AAE3ZY53_9ACTN|nr:hypothetical protein [Catenuloplanes niger]MDR7327062.1 hypothetical protein [Catenuloplanes niger]
MLADTDPVVPYLHGDLPGDAALALVRPLGDAHADPAFETLARIPTVSGPEASPVVGAALRHAFPAGPVTPGTAPADLTPSQRHRTGAVFADMIHRYGLPATPAALPDLCGSG